MLNWKSSNSGHFAKVGKKLAAYVITGKGHFCTEIRRRKFPVSGIIYHKCNIKSLDEGKRSLEEVIDSTYALEREIMEL
jgi:hypothetical protein